MRKLKVKQTINIIAILFICAMAHTTQAAIYTVNQLGDAGDGTCDATCTLRDAVTTANGTPDNDTVNFSVSGTITLGGTEITITNNGTLTIDGPGADQLTISGNNASRIFEMSLGSNLTVNGLTLTNGNPVINTSGGAIRNGGTNLVVNRCAIAGNTAFGGGGIVVLGGGNATITQSTISGNQTTNNFGGGIYVLGSNASATITNSTISGNTSVLNGGGISVENGTLNLSYTTIANNTANCSGMPPDPCGGGGLDVFNSTVNVGSSIIADNNAANGPDIFGTVNSQNYNLFENTSGATINGATANNITGIDPNLVTLGNNGGTTQTHRLQTGSPAIDAANPGNFPPFDQRENIRPADGDSNGSLLPDIGAFEALAPTAAAASISGRVLSPNSRGVANAIVHITNQDGNIKTARTNPFGYYRFEEIEVGQTLIVNVYSKSYQFTTQVITVNDSITNLNFTANTLFREKE